MVKGLAGFRFEVQRTGVHTHRRVAAGGFHMFECQCLWHSLGQQVRSRPHGLEIACLIRSCLAPSSQSI